MINELLSRLDKVKSKGANRWVACCSAHEDKTPSLAITDLNGKILLHCFSGCSPIDIINAVGLEMSDLFPDEGQSDFKGFINIQREIAAKKLNTEIDNVNNEKEVLIIAKKMRENGEKLTQADLAREKEAYLKIREFKSSENINR